MAKPATVKIKLVSSADTGFYYGPKESAQHEREDVVPQI